MELSRTAAERGEPTDRDDTRGFASGRGWVDYPHELIVERDDVLDELRRAVVELSLGRSSMVAVTGEQGTGRTVLARAAVTHARSLGLSAAFARCSPAEADIRYGVVAQLETALTGDAASLRRAWARDPATASVTPSLCGLFVALARERPTLLVVDDEQWADRESQQWLAAMARRLHHAPMLLIRVSSTPPTGDNRSVGSSFGSQPVPSESIQARPLDEGGVRRVIAARYAGTVEPTFVTAVTSATAGNPGALVAVLDHFARGTLAPVEANIPAVATHMAAVRDVRVAEAISCLPEDALGLLQAIAHCGEHVGFGFAASLAAPKSMPLSQAVAALRVLGLVADGEEPRLADPAIAHQVLSRMDVTQRHRLAHRAVDVGYRIALPEDRLADLILKAPPTAASWVVELLRRAARERRRTGDHDGAAALLGRALQERVPARDRCELLIELGGSEVGDDPGAGDSRLHRVLLEAGPHVPIPVMMRAADLLQSRGDSPAAHRSIATAVGRYRASGLDAGSLAAIGWLAENDCAGDPLLPLSACPDAPAATVEPALAGVAAWALAVRGRNRSRARELARRALDAVTDDGPFGPRIYACLALICAEDLTEAVIGLDDVVADARRRGARAPAALALLHRGRCELLRGNLPQAADDLDAARAELPRTSWHPRSVPVLVAFEADLHLARGSVPEAGHVLSAEFPQGADQGVAWASVLRARANINLARADPHAALRDAYECGRVLLSRRWSNPAVSPWRSLAVAAHDACGDRDAAMRLAHNAVSRARRWGARRALGAAMESVTRVHHLTAKLVRGDAPAPSEPALPLSPQEHRAAVLAARGLSNPEIARILSVSTRTVELRLTGVYRKLAVPGRAALATVLPSGPGD